MGNQDKLKELQETYIEETKESSYKSKMMALMGASGVSPDKVTQFLKDLDTIANFKNNLNK